MKQVLALELVGLTELNCNLYDENKKVVYREGTPFTPEIFMQLSQIKVYRREDENLTKDEQIAPPITKPTSEEDGDATLKSKKSSDLDIDDSNSEKKHRDGFNELSQKELKQGFTQIEEDSIQEINQKNHRDDFNDIDEQEQALSSNSNYEDESSDKKKKLSGDILDSDPKLNLKDKMISKQAESLRVNRTNETIAQQKARMASQEKAFDGAKTAERKVTRANAEFKSEIEEDKKDILLSGVKEVLYSAINTAPMDIRTCVDATETILNVVYTKIGEIDNINEIRVHDYYTFSHSLNVSLISAVIGREMEYNDKKVKDLAFSAFLHDVGKMRVPREILYKPGAHTESEKEIMREHTIIGFDFLVNGLGIHKELARPALEHHERWDGQGYPQGLKGDEISEFSQIVAIADVYDALLTDKVYRDGIQAMDAMKILLTEEVKSFNPEILNKFIYLCVGKKKLR